MALLSSQDDESRRYRLFDRVSGGSDAAPCSGTTTRPTISTTAAALTATLGLAAACWVFAVREMNGMDMGVATQLGSFVFFVAVWISMMAAMMLSGAAPAVLRFAHANGGIRAVPLFVGSYLVVWGLVGVAVYAVDRPHGTIAAGAVAPQVSASSRLSSSTSAGAAARVSALDSSSGSTASARASD